MGPSGPNPKSQRDQDEMRWTRTLGNPRGRNSSRPRGAVRRGLAPVPAGAKRQPTLSYLADDDSGAAGSVGVAGAGTTGSGASGGPQP